MDIWETILTWLLTHGLRIVIILVGAYIVLKVIERILEHAIEALLKKQDVAQRSDVAFEKRQKTLHSVADSAIRVVLLVLAGLMVLSEVGVDIAPLIATAGVAGLALGFGGQYLIRDVIAGLFIIVEDQYRTGDVVKIAGVSGVVEDVNLRRTILRDLDGIEHDIPNGEITVTSNMTKYWSRVHLNIGVDYDTDLDHAIDVLNRVCQELADDPAWRDDITKAPRVLGVDDFGDSAIEIKLLGDTKPSRQWDVTRELRKRIKTAFDTEGISIPFPHRTIVQKKTARKRK